MVKKSTLKLSGVSILENRRENVLVAVLVLEPKSLYYWPITDHPVPSNNFRNNCGTHFCSNSRLVSKVGNFSSVLTLMHRQIVDSCLLLSVKTFLNKFLYVLTNNRVY